MLVECIECMPMFDTLVAVLAAGLMHMQCKRGISYRTPVPPDIKGGRGLATCATCVQYKPLYNPLLALAAETALCTAPSSLQARCRCRAGDITHLHWYCTLCTVLSLALAQRVLISTCDAGDVAAPRHCFRAQFHDAA